MIAATLVAAGAPDRAPTYNIHVDSVAGNDTTGTGTKTLPYATLSKAFTVVTAGQSIGIKRGSTLRQTTTVPASTITVGAYGPATRHSDGMTTTNDPIMDGGQVITGWSTYTATASNPQLITNNTLDSWGNVSGGYYPIGYNIFSAGADAVITEETTTRHTASGSAVRIASTGSTMLFEQAGAVVGGTSYTVSHWSRSVSGTPTLEWSLQMTSGADSGKYLQSNGTWSATTYRPSIGQTTTYTQASKVFTPPSDGNCLLTYRINAGTVLVDDLSFQQTTPPSVSPNLFRVAMATQTYLVRRNDVRMPMGANTDFLAEGNFFWQSNFLYIRNNAGNPDGAGAATIEAAQLGTAITCTSRSRVTIKNIHFRLYNSRAVNFNSSTFCAVDHVWLTSVGYGGIDPVTGVATGTNGGVIFNSSNDGEARWCRLDDVSTDGLYTLSSNRATFRDNIINTVYGQYSDAIQMDFVSNTGNTGANYQILRNRCDKTNNQTAKGTIIAFGDNGVIRGNIVTNGGGFGVSANGDNVLVEGNVISGCTDGLYSEGNSSSYDGIIFRRNLVSNCDRGIYLTNASKTNCLIQHNTFAGLTSSGAELDATMTGTQFKNNIVRSNTGVAVLRFPNGGVTSNYNDLGPESTAFINYNGTTYNTLAAYKTGTSQDLNSVNGDPLFVDTVAYQPGSGSPARNSGVVISGVNDGYLGSAPDMGYVEVA